MKADLNLLVVLDAVLRHRSVSKAATDLALSQPAVSHALNRLRAQLQDPLVLRGQGGLVPTPRALALAPTLVALVASAKGMMQPERFDPATSNATLRIAASDYALCALLPRLLQALAPLAPDLRMTAEPAGSATLDRLKEGSVDLSFWGTTPPQAPYHHLPLFQEHYLGVAHRGHPVLATCGTSVTLEAFLAARHAVVSLGDPGLNEIDQALARLGAKRRIAVATPSFSGNLAAVRCTDLVASLPSRLCDHLPDDLVAFPLPFPVPPYAYGIVWHHRTQNDTAQTWLRDRMIEEFEMIRSGC